MTEPPEESDSPEDRPRRWVVGLQAEAEARSQAARRAAGRDGRLRSETAGGQLSLGTCPCGMPATATCSAGCGRATCGEHLMNRASRLGSATPFRSEREHTVYLRAFRAGTGPLCTWCREEAGAAAVAELAPPPALPEDPVERLTVLLHRPHEYPCGAWDETVHEHGGAAAVLRLLAPGLWRSRATQQLDGRRNGHVLTGVLVRRPGKEPLYELVDAAGTAWTVRQVRTGIGRRGPAWTWERTAEDDLARLLPHILRLTAR